MTLLSLANELLLCVVDHMEKERDVSALARSSRRLYFVFNSHLYQENAKKHRSSALFWAAEYGRSETLKLALAEGSDVEATLTEVTKSFAVHNARHVDSERIYEGMTPLQIAILRGHESVAELLLDNDADFKKVHQMHSDRPSMPHFACFLGMTSTVSLLLDKGANIEGRDSGGRTPLHFAVATYIRGQPSYWPGIIETVALLLAHGATINVRDKRGKETPRDFAKRNPDPFVRKLLENGVWAFIRAGVLDRQFEELVNGKNRLQLAEISKEKPAQNKERKLQKLMAKEVAKREEEELKGRVEEEMREELRREAEQAKEQKAEADQRRVADISRLQKQDSLRKKWTSMKERATQSTGTSARSLPQGTVNCSHTSIASAAILLRTLEETPGKKMDLGQLNGTSPSGSPLIEASLGGYSRSRSAANGSAHGANGNAENPRFLLDRRTSLPMMPTFMTSAPGKVIVLGEHAVVHGKAAIAAAISLRSYMHVTTLSKSYRIITLLFPDIGLNHTWNIDELPWPLFSHPSKKKFYYDLVTALDPELVEAMQPHISTVSPHLPPESRKVNQTAASAFLYLFLSLCSRTFPGCIYTLRSTLPIGAGLGSSASVNVCISSALLLQVRSLSGPHPDQPRDEAELQIERINRWAFVGEMCIHGNPSGVDNTCAAGGKAVIFKRIDYSKPPTVTPLRNFPELPLLLVNSRQPRSTANEVAKVAELRRTQPVVAESLLNAIDKVTESAHEIIADDPFYNDSFHRFGELIIVNHGLLVSLGVSHPKLERIRETVDTMGLGWTKLTGGGGGGCTITLLKPDATPDVLEILHKKLEADGFERFETTLGGDGVGVLWPAVLKYPNDEGHGEEIDQEMFLRADGREGVENLVGVGIQEKKVGWKFWSQRLGRSGLSQDDRISALPSDPMSLSNGLSY